MNTDTLTPPRPDLPSGLRDLRTVPLGQLAVDTAATGRVVARVLPKQGVDRVGVASFQSAI